MEPLSDRIVATAVSLTAFLVVPVDASTMGLLLGAFALSLVASLLPERVGIVVLVVSVAFAAVYGPGMLFLAPITYGCVSSRIAWVRWTWIVSLLAALWTLSPDAWLLGVALNLASCAIALRCSSLLRERRQYRVLRDSVREQSLALESRNQQLRDQVRSLQGSSSAPHSPGHSHDGGTDSATCESMVDLRPTLVLANLTERELEIASHVARGLDNREIAAEVFASEGTVRNHISAILQKSHLRNRTQLAVAYLNSVGR